MLFRSVPVATVAINGAKNAGILAAKILAVSDEKVRAAVEQLANDMKAEVMAKDAKLQSEGYKAFL